MTTKIIKNSYNAGQLSPYMDGRTDINKYYNGCSKLINAYVLPHGGFTKRPGSIYKATAAGRAKLVPFEFSVDDSLILEFTASLLRFYKDQAIVYKPYGTETLSGVGTPIAHWKCNDNDEQQQVDDATGDHHGTLAGATTTADVTTADYEGTANSAFDLDSLEYFTAADHADFTYGDGATDSAFSVIGWYEYDNGGAVQTLWAKYNDSATQYEYRCIMDNSGYIYVYLYNNNSAVQLIVVQTDSTYSAGWHFIAVTYSGNVSSNAVIGSSASDVGLSIYVDYIPVKATVKAISSYTAMTDTTAVFSVGAAGDGDNTWWGAVDNVSVWDKELTLTEIASLTGNTSTTALSVVSPYTIAQAFNIHYTQSADVMYFAHEDVHPKKLTRYADQSWVIENVPFIGGPFLTENIDTNKTLQFARTGGAAEADYYYPIGTTGTLTASGHPPFKSTHVGSLWLLKHTRVTNNSTSTFNNDTNATPGTGTTYATDDAVLIKGDATVTFEPVASGHVAMLWRHEGNGSWQKYRTFQSATAFSWTEDADDVYYCMTRNNVAIGGILTAKNSINRGIVKVTGYTSSTVVTCEVVDLVLTDNAGTSATTSEWAEGAWSDYRGYPRTVGFHEDRLWWWSSTNNPDTGWGSKTGDYENHEFTDTGLDDDAVIVTIGDNEVSQIQWMMPRQVMAIGAANREYRLSAQNPDDPITPTDKKATPQTGFSSSNIQPQMLNDSIFFLQRQGKKLGAMKFDSITENFDVDDATLLAYGLLDSAPTDMAISRSPDSQVWVVRTDGNLPVFTYEPKEEVSGWGEMIFGNSADADTATGYVESSAVIHGSTEDEVWLCVRRVINSSTVYYIELLAPRSWGTDIEDAIYVDSALTYDSTATTTVTAAHLKGETLAVFADGEVFDNAVADATTGVLTLKKGGTTTAASVVQYGLAYTMKARSMRLAVPQAVGTLQTKIKRITNVTVRYIKSLLGSAGTEYGGTEYLTDINASYSAVSADTDPQYRLTQGGFNEDAYVTIVSDDPVPFTALASIVEVEID